MSADISSSSSPGYLTDTGGCHQFIRSVALLQFAALILLASFSPDFVQSTITPVKYMLRRSFVCDFSPKSALGAGGPSPASQATFLPVVITVSLKPQREMFPLSVAIYWWVSIFFINCCHIQRTHVASVKSVLFVLVWIRTWPDQCVLGHYLGNTPQ